MPFPVFSDDGGGVFEAVGRPPVPSLVMATSGGRVLMIHEGTIGDFDGILKELRKLHGEYQEDGKGR